MKRDGDSRRSQSNFLVHRYVDSLMQADLFHTDGGAESFNDWLRAVHTTTFGGPKMHGEQFSRQRQCQVSRPFAQTCNIK